MIRIEYEPRDLWIGVFYKRTYLDHGWGHWMDMWICIVPMFPIHITYYVSYR